MRKFFETVGLVLAWIVLAAVIVFSVWIGISQEGITFSKWIQNIQRAAIFWVLVVLIISMIKGDKHRLMRRVLIGCAVLSFVICIGEFSYPRLIIAGILCLLCSITVIQLDRQKELENKVKELDKLLEERKEKDPPKPS